MTQIIKAQARAGGISGKASISAAYRISNKRRSISSGGIKRRICAGAHAAYRRGGIALASAQRAGAGWRSG